MRRNNSLKYTHSHSRNETELKLLFLVSKQLIPTLHYLAIWVHSMPSLWTAQYDNHYHKHEP